MLKVTIPQNFVAERTYILAVLLSDFLGLEYEIKSESTADCWDIRLENGNRLIFEDHFFLHIKPSDNYYEPQYIPKQVRYVANRFLPESNVAVIFGGPEPSVRTLTVKGQSLDEKTMVCTIDIFAGAFFMLTRWEEYALDKRDVHGRFPASEALAVKYGFIDRPVVNEYIEMLWNLLAQLGIAQKRKGRKCELYLTHDIDFTTLWKDFRGFIKSLGGDIIKRQSIPLVLTNAICYLKTLLGSARQPYDTFDYLMTQSEKRGVRSHFFFMSGGVTKYDNQYNINDPAVLNTIRQIKNRGHAIGFHPGYGTCDNRNQWTSEYKSLSSACQSAPTEGRQHYLKFRVPDTWRIWDEHNMQSDSSMGYPEREGFRCGTCYDFSVFDILSRRTLAAREKPLIAMDTTLVEHRRMPPERMQRKLEKLMDRVYRYNGTFTLLWHNTSFNLYPWPKYQAVYEHTLDYASERISREKQTMKAAPARQPKRKRAVLLTFHCRHSKRQAGFHQLAQSLRNQGWETLFFTAPYSLISKLRNDYRTQYIQSEETNKLMHNADGDYSFVLKTLWHPVNLRHRPLNILSTPLFKMYDRFLSGEAMEFMRQADLFIFESTASLLFLDKLKHLNPNAKMIYRVSDDLRLLKAHPIVLETEKQIAPKFDLISSPSAYLHRRFERFDQAYLDYHGLRRDLYDKCYDNPYDASVTNAIFIGQAHLDYNFLKTAAQNKPDWKFHVIGPLSPDFQADNIIYYGEKPFRETIPYIKHADIGLHTLKFRPGARSFTDSLKVIQYTYCRLPIVAPDYLKCDRENFIFYHPGDQRSIAAALEKVAKFDGESIDIGNIHTWDDLVETMLERLYRAETAIV